MVVADAESAGSMYLFSVDFAAAVQELALEAANFGHYE